MAYRARWIGAVVATTAERFRLLLTAFGTITGSQIPSHRRCVAGNLREFYSTRSAQPIGRMQLESI